MKGKNLVVACVAVIAIVVVGGLSLNSLRRPGMTLEEFNEHTHQLMEDGRYEELAGIYRGVFETGLSSQDPGDRLLAVSGGAGLANCMLKLERYDEAVEAITKVIQLAESLNSEYPDIVPRSLLPGLYRVRANALNSLGEIDDARRDAGRANEIERKLVREKEEFDEYERMIRSSPSEALPPAN